MLKKDSKRHGLLFVKQLLLSSIVVHQNSHIQSADYFSANTRIVFEQLEKTLCFASFLRGFCEERKKAELDVWTALAAKTFRQRFVRTALFNINTDVGYQLAVVWKTFRYPTKFPTLLQAGNVTTRTRANRRRFTRTVVVIFISFYFPDKVS